MIRLVHSLLAIFSVSYDCVAIYRLRAACNTHVPHQEDDKGCSWSLTSPILHLITTGYR